MAGEFRFNLTWLSLLWFVSVSSVFSMQKTSANHKHDRRKLDDVRGSIDIDCGLSDELGYTDEKTGIPYNTDSKVIDTGENRDISIEFISEDLERTFRNVRSFPKGKRNCYTLRHPEGRNTVYLLRASFLYGNFDELNQPPKFDLYLGVNWWDTLKFENSSQIVIKEILHVPPIDVVHVCLLNTDKGTPFISALQMRHLHNQIYINKPQTLALVKRLDFGSTTNETVRLKEDAYDRIWYPYNLPDCKSVSTSLTIDSLNNAYRLPSAVMRTAIKPANDSDETLEVQFDTGDAIARFYVYMHFAEIEKLQGNEHREFNITLNGKLLNESVDYVVLNYLDLTTIHNPQPITGQKLWFSLNKKENSNFPPILNALEIYPEKDSYQEPTDQEDVKAIMAIKEAYDIKSWQGDPCAPESYSWDRLKCSFNKYDPPRIIKIDLSSRNLSITISQSFSMLKTLEYLDLSNNSLTGPLPDFFVNLQHLKTLNLSGNKLSGEIPLPLIERSKNGSLSLSVDGNPDLCLQAPCKGHKSNFPLHTVIAIISSLVLFIVLCIVACIIWRRRSRKKPENQPVTSHEEVVLKSSNTQFTYSQIANITNNFENMIGKGGSGTVYHGCLSDETQVAVKLLSSPESFKLFQTEAELLMRVHHRNLASFLGYCNEGGHTAIVYEFMAHGNLEKCLSGSMKELSSWKNRIQIAVEAAQGLEYLHHGCKPPIVHRDIKTSNILLNEKLQAKVADFGFSKSFSTESESHISTGVIGTFGYLDPEYYSSYRLTEKSDVYSFGIVLLELITGHRAIIKGYKENTHIVNWATPFIERGDLQQIVDSRLQGDFDFGSMWKAVESAIACVSPTSIQRPSMSHVVLELKESLEMEAAHERKSQQDSYGKMMESNSSFNTHVVDFEAASGPEAR